MYIKKKKESFSFSISNFFKTKFENEICLYNLYREKGNRLYLFLILESIFFKIFKFIAKSFISFLFFYYVYFFLSIIDDDRKFFAASVDSSEKNQLLLSLGILKKNTLSSESILGNNSTTEYIEVDRVTLFFNFLFQQMRYFLTTGRITLGNTFHNPLKVDSSVAEQIEKKIFPFTQSFLFFSFTILLISILFSSLSFVFTFLSFTNEGFFLFLKTFVYCVDFIPIISFLLIYIWQSGNIVNIYFKHIKTEQIFEPQRSDILLLIFISLNYFIFHLKKDIDFFHLEKEKPYLRVVLINGVQTKGVLNIMKNKIIKHKINNFFPRRLLYLTHALIIPSKFSNTSLFKPFFRTLTVACCYNPFLSAARASLINTFTTFFYYFVDYIMCFSLSYWDEKLVARDKKNIFKKIEKTSIILFIRSNLFNIQKFYV